MNPAPCCLKTPRMVTYLTGGIPQTVVGGDTLVRLQLVYWNS